MAAKAHLLNIEAVYPRLRDSQDCRSFQVDALECRWEEALRAKNEALRRKLALIGEVKRISLDEDAREHLALPIGERFLATVRLSEAHIRAFPDSVFAKPFEDEARTWARVRARLAGRG
jgi:hypothetical protein